MRTLHTSPTSSEGLPTNIQPRIQPNRPACHGRQPLHPNLCAEFASLHQTVSYTYELNPRDKKLPNKVLKNRCHTQRLFRGLLKLLPVTPQLVYGSRLSVTLPPSMVVATKYQWNLRYWVH